MVLDVHSSIPLHAQLATALKKDILRGVYKHRIPSESELIKAFSVSRITVREAVSALVREGVLEKIQGKGTFIAPTKNNIWIGALDSMTDTIKNLGMTPGVRLLSAGIQSAPEIAAVLGRPSYYVVERLRLADGIPIALEKTYYPVEIGERLSKYDLNEVTIYDALEKEGIIFDVAEQRITATIPSSRDAELLGVETGISVLAAERVTYDPEGKIVGYNSSLFRADRYSFHVRMYRKGGHIIANLADDVK